ncbi:hypothetical protein LK08_15235 [Streptomyces sp. MUSC 125]|nr:hypothetical protein LK08_15235 [Streptomyces sp. MUSC 125]
MPGPGAQDHAVPQGRFVLRADTDIVQPDGPCSSRHRPAEALGSGCATTPEFPRRHRHHEATEAVRY